MAYYYFKAHNKAMLDDPSIGALKDWAWRIYWQCYAAAQEAGNNGLLPPLPTLAWRIRANEKTLADALQAMRKLGLAIETDAGWSLTRFADEQKALSDRERKRMSRARHESVTECDAELKIDLNSSSSSAARVTATNEKVFTSYSENIGPLTATVAQDIGTYLDDGVSPTWLVDAFAIAARVNKRSWAYAEAIIRRWISEGKDAGRKPVRKNGKQGNAALIAALER